MPPMPDPAKSVRAILQAPFDQRVHEYELAGSPIQDL